MTSPRWGFRLLLSVLFVRSFVCFVFNTAQLIYSCACIVDHFAMRSDSTLRKSILLNVSLKSPQYLSLRDRHFCLAPVKQLGEVSWSVVCAACCHMALVFAVTHLYDIFVIVIASVHSFSDFVNIWY